MASSSELGTRDSGLTHMPVGSLMALPLRQSEVTTTEGNERPAVWSDDATANLVWNDYQRAKAYVEAENTALLLVAD